MNVRCVVMLCGLVASACASPSIEEPALPSPVRVGLGPDVYSMVSFVPIATGTHLLGREAVLDHRGVAAILGGTPVYEDGRPYPVRYTPLDPFPRRFMISRQVAYISDAQTRDERLQHTEFAKRGSTTDVRVDIDGTIYSWEFDGPPPDLDPARPIVTAAYVAWDDIDYVSEHETNGWNCFAVRIGGVAGPPGELLVDHEDSRVELEARILPSTRIVVWALEDEPRLLWASGRTEAFDPARLSDTHAEDPDCQHCRESGHFALHRGAALPVAVPLEVTYLAWHAPDIPEPLSRESWQEYRSKVAAEHVRSQTVSIPPRDVEAADSQRRSDGRVRRVRRAR